MREIRTLLNFPLSKVFILKISLKLTKFYIHLDLPYLNAMQANIHYIYYIFHRSNNQSRHNFSLGKTFQDRDPTKPETFHNLFS